MDNTKDAGRTTIDNIQARDQDLDKIHPSDENARSWQCLRWQTSRLTRKPFISVLSLVAPLLAASSKRSR
eukprot:scaffold381262_cov18-Prasinocladus_malaysianus.AAC.1